MPPRLRHRALHEHQSVRTPWRRLSTTNFILRCVTILDHIHTNSSSPFVTSHPIAANPARLRQLYDGGRSGELSFDTRRACMLFRSPALSCSLAEDFNLTGFLHTDSGPESKHNTRGCWRSESSMPLSTAKGGRTCSSLAAPSTFAASRMPTPSALSRPRLASI